MRYVVYMIKRIFLLIITLLVVSCIVFFLIRASGKDPMITLIGTKTVSDEIKMETMQKYNLDKSTWEQYTIWLDGVFHGEFGTSYSTKQPVKDSIMERLPVTLGLVFFSMLIAIVIAIPLGIICALFSNTWIDQLISTILLVFTSTPSFLMALVFLILIPKILPGYAISGSINSRADFFARISVPAVVLALFMVALLARILKSSVVEQLKSSYVMVAKAKGLSTFQIMKRHVIQNSIIPLLTIAGTMIGGGIGGSVLVESIFSLPGLGSLLLEAINANNYPVIQIIVMIILFIYLVSSMLVDFLYAVIDPRISL